ncbi:MAG: hypothetical protein WDA16_11280, partial [Candidatus Thermoplasmatota archaeon]
MKRIRDEASTSTFGILGALVVLVMTFSFAASLPSSHSTTRLEDRSLEHDARLTLQELTKASSYAGSASWLANPDSLSSFGLARADEPGRLDARSLDLLARGSLASAPNGAPDYADVKTALGAPIDFHLRVRSVVPQTSASDWEPLPGRVAYFGHYFGARAPATATTTPTSSPSELNVTVNVTNQAAFSAVFTMNVALGDAATGKVLVSHDRHTTLLSPGETQSVWVRIPALSSWSPKANAIRVAITDPYGNPATDLAGAAIPSPWMSVSLPTTSPAAQAFVLQAANPYYVAGKDVKFDVDAHDGSGKHAQASTRFVLVGPNGHEWTNETVDLPREGQSTTWSCANCTIVGNYTAKLLDSAARTLALDRVHVSADTMFKEKTTLDAVASIEIGMIDALVDTFDPTRFSASTSSGDVFGDDVNGPTELPSVISRYDVIIIGSEASHHALSPADVKHAITAWVDAGGTLIVLGTSQDPSRWLQSEYGLALGQATGTPNAPDPVHALLTEPEALAHAGYLFRSRAWQLPVGDSFEHVLTLGATSDGGSRDTLAISRPGAFGNGTIVLTSYLPGSLASPIDADEATRLLHNLLVHSNGR